jgi:hypothetical protein
MLPSVEAGEGIYNDVPDNGVVVVTQVKDEAVAIASKCNADIRVSSLATDSPAVQRDIFLHIGQIVVSTPGQVAQVRTQR